jgi:ABC-type multidrug transport system ATPase subunit
MLSSTLRTRREAANEMSGLADLLVMRGVTRCYDGVPVLRGVDLTLAPGGCVALVGSNGAGKSTLLRIAAGRESPTSGDVLFKGTLLDGDRAEVRRAIATVMDAGVFYPDLTVREHLMLVALAHGLGKVADGAVSQVLEDHHLTGQADLLPSALSSGQRQQLLLAAAFVRPHELIILDEPEQRLDADARHELADRLARHKESGRAVLMATHRDELVAAVADQVVRVNGMARADGGGQIRATGGERDHGDAPC